MSVLTPIISLSSGSNNPPNSTICNRDHAHAVHANFDHAFVLRFTRYVARSSFPNGENGHHRRRRSVSPRGDMHHARHPQRMLPQMERFPILVQIAERHRAAVCMRCVEGSPPTGLGREIIRKAFPHAFLQLQWRCEQSMKVGAFTITLKTS